MKVHDLDGADLDARVAIADGLMVEHVNIGKGWMIVVPGKGVLSAGRQYSPSTLWEQGGRILEREGISVYQNPDWSEGKTVPRWIAGCGLYAEPGQQWDDDIGPPTIETSHTATGDTYLQAGMRSFLLKKLKFSEA